MSGPARSFLVVGLATGVAVVSACEAGRSTLAGPVASGGAAGGGDRDRVASGGWGGAAPSGSGGQPGSGGSRSASGGGGAGGGSVRAASGGAGVGGITAGGPGGRGGTGGISVGAGAGARAGGSSAGGASVGGSSAGGGSCGVSWQYSRGLLPETGGAGGEGGAAGALEIERVDVNVGSASSSSRIIVPCPAGKTVLGAGWTLARPSCSVQDGTASAFLPAADGSAWLIDAAPATADEPWTLQASATCASVPGWEQATVTTPADLAVRKAVAVGCPTGKLAVGAGWAVLSEIGAVIAGRLLQFQVAPDGSSWSVVAENVSSDAVSMLQARIICVSPASVPHYRIIRSPAPAINAATRYSEIVSRPFERVIMAGWTLLDPTGAPIDGGVIASNYDAIAPGRWNIVTTSSLPGAGLYIRVISVNRN